MKPEEEEFNAEKFRKIKAGNPQVQLKKGDAQVINLQKALQRTMEEPIMSRKLEPKVLLEMKDMDEAVEKAEIIDGVLNTAGQHDTG